MRKLERGEANRKNLKRSAKTYFAKAILCKVVGKDVEEAVGPL